MKRFLVFLLGLVVLLVIGDRIAVFFAERELGNRLQDHESFGERPDVDIHGFPFLTQLVSRRLNHVDITAEGVQVPRAEVSEVRAELYGAEPRDGYSAVNVDRVIGHAFMTYADLQRAIGRPGYRISSGGEGLLRIDGRAEVLGQEVDVTAYSEVSVSDSSLVVRTQRVEAEGRELPGASGLARELDFAVPLRGLPNQARLEGVEVTAEGVEVTVSAQDVTYPD